MKSASEQHSKQHFRIGGASTTEFSGGLPDPFPFPTMFTVFLRLLNIVILCHLEKYSIGASFFSYNLLNVFWIRLNHKVFLSLFCNLKFSSVNVCWVLNSVCSGSTLLKEGTGAIYFFVALFIIDIH